jgi:hypothetical protein
MSLAGRTPTALIILAPVREGRCDALLSSLGALPEGPASPFGRVPSTHFCRCVVFPALLDGDGEPTADDRAYLLLTADFDCPLDSWLEQARSAVPELEGLLAHCEGFEPGGGAALAAFVADHRVQAGFSVRSYEASVATIQQSLELARSWRRFAVDCQGLEPAALKAAWMERFAR